MKSIHTLIVDIQEILKDKGDWFNDSIRASFESSAGAKVQASFTQSERRGLRISGLGDKCPKALWHSIHTPELAEPLPAWAEFKYAYGHIIEALAISLAKAAGHEVTGEQDELVVDGITGHRDCVIDGCVVDVKSAASRSFIKFKDKTLHENDSFGYLYQLDGYVLGSSSDPLVHVKDKGYFLAIDKQLGHMCLYEHQLRLDKIRSRIKNAKDVCALGSPPNCTCRSVPYGSSGNFALDVPASYNPYKFCCNPNIRTFLYAYGPAYLTKVNRVPDVMEVDKSGRYVYN